MWLLCGYDYSYLQGIKAVVTLNEEFEVFISKRQYQVTLILATGNERLFLISLVEPAFPPFRSHPHLL